MRKKCLFFIVCILMLACYSSSVKAEINSALLADGETGSIVDFCLWEDSYIVLGSKGIFEWKPASLSLKCIKNEKELPDTVRKSLVQLEGTICFWQGELCIADPSNGSIWQVKDLTGPVFVIPENDFLYDEPQGVMRKKIRRIFSIGNEIWFLLNSFTFENGNTNELYYMTPDRRFELYNEPDLLDAFPALDGILLQKAVGQDTIYTFLNDEKHEKLVAIPETEEEIITGFAWDNKTGFFYGVAENGQVYRQGQPCTILPFPVCYKDGKGIVVNNTYAYLQDGSLVVRNLSEKSPCQKELRIMGKPDNEELILQYQVMHPDIKIIIDPRSEDFYGLQEAAISLDSDVDLFLVNSDNLYARMLEKGYVKDLDQSSKLVGLAKQFYPWLRENVFCGDSLTAWPLSVNAEFWTINRTLWTYFGLGNYPTTWQEMLSLMMEWNTSQNAVDYPELCFLECDEGFPGIVSTVIHQYLLEYEKNDEMVEFNTKEFRDVLQVLYDYQDVFVETQGKMPLIMTYPQYLGIGRNDADIVESFLPPALTSGGKSQVRTSAQLLTINITSKNYDEALSFLEFVADHTTHEMQYMMYENMTNPLRPDDYAQEQEKLLEEIAFLEELIIDDSEKIQEQIRIRQEAYESNEKDYWTVSPEDLTVWIPLVSHFVMPLETVYPDDNSAEMQSFKTLINKFTDGALTPDRMIIELNNCAAMIYYENH